MRPFLPSARSLRSGESRTAHRCLLSATILAIAVGPLLDAAASAQASASPSPPPGATATSPAIGDPNFADRPISAISVKGLSRVSRQEIDNNIRVAAGQPFEATAIRADVATLYRLGQFSTVSADAQLLYECSF
jgi:outer membrane protein assembly factor BamA